MLLVQDLTTTLQTVVQRLGAGVAALSFAIHSQRAGQTLTPADFVWHVTDNGHDLICTGSSAHCQVQWSFVAERDGYWVRLQLEAKQPLLCTAIDSLIVTYAPETEALADWWIPTCGGDVAKVGTQRVSALHQHNRRDKLLRGAFANSTQPGLFVGVQIPQTHEHWFDVAVQANALIFTCSTHFRTTLSQHTQLTSEATWLCANKRVQEAIHAYAAHLPFAPAPLAAPPSGWNSWDYYFSAVGLDDLIENMDTIRADPRLTEKVKYIVLDMGWEHKWGEWEPNYRFPGGLERVVAEIRQRGFIPGIWTAPSCVEALSTTALRTPEVLVKNAHGDPQASYVSNHYILDPTHPAGEQFILRLYTRLYQAGFRFFKIDYTDDLQSNHHYHDPSAGPYDAMRRLYALIRQAVTDDSHLLGCSLPPETGAWIADSGRIGIDIHNQWSHVAWVADYLQWLWWLHGRVWINDPDFLLVRGPTTSHEAVTNVLYPKAHDPNPPRWRSGPEFTPVEAQTWANLVILTGGNLFLSDRISQVNAVGQALIAQALALSAHNTTGVAAEPLDLCDAARPSLWLQTLPDQFRLAVINWLDQPVERRLDWVMIPTPVPDVVTNAWNGQSHILDQEQLVLQLASHESVLLVWRR